MQKRHRVFLRMLGCVGVFGLVECAFLLGCNILEDIRQRGGWAIGLYASVTAVCLGCLLWLTLNRRQRRSSETEAAGDGVALQPEMEGTVYSLRLEFASTVTAMLLPLAMAGGTTSPHALKCAESIFGVPAATLESILKWQGNIAGLCMICPGMVAFWAMIKVAEAGASRMKSSVERNDKVASGAGLATKVETRNERDEQPVNPHW